MAQNLRVAIIGTRGIPAKYGGFETAVEEIAKRLPPEFDLTIYCRNKGQKLTALHGAELVNLPAFRRKSLETLSHTAASLVHLMFTRPRPDVVLLFNAANVPFSIILLFLRIPFAIHVDGLESRRSKWGPIGRTYYRWCERASALVANVLVVDARAIGKHYEERYAATTCFIPYGAPLLSADDVRRTEVPGLPSEGYHLIVARFEPENNIDLMMQGYIESSALLPLVVVGGAPYADMYSSKLRAIAESDQRVLLYGTEYLSDRMDAIYCRASSYLHGHSVGGTNPSLLRAIGAGRPVIAHDNVFNREVAGDLAVYVRNTADVSGAIAAVETNPRLMAEKALANRDRVIRLYNWEKVADDYATLCRGLL